MIAAGVDPGSAGRKSPYQRLLDLTQAELALLTTFGDYGVAAGITSTVLTDPSKAWATGQWIGYILEILTGPGSGQFGVITSNTATTATVLTAFPIVPGTNVVYKIFGPSYRVESATNPNIAVSIFGGANEASVLAAASIVNGLVTQIALSVVSFGVLFNTGTGNWDLAREPTLIAQNGVAGAASAQLIAAGGAGKKYRIFAMALSGAETVTTGLGENVVTINEVTSGTVLLSARIPAGVAGGDGTGETISLAIPGGVVQPTANNAIQVTSVASINASATIVYSQAE